MSDCGNFLTEVYTMLGKVDSVKMRHKQLSTGNLT